MSNNPDFALADESDKFPITIDTSRLLESIDAAIYPDEVNGTTVRGIGVSIRDARFTTSNPEKRYRIILYIVMGSRERKTLTVRVYPGSAPGSYFASKTETKAALDTLAEIYREYRQGRANREAARKVLRYKQKLLAERHKLDAASLPGPAHIEVSENLTAFNLEMFDIPLELAEDTRAFIAKVTASKPQKRE